MNQAETDIKAFFRTDTTANTLGYALTIGNFDGCHLGHQKLINSTLATADRLQINAASLTFSPRPDVFFHPERARDGNLFNESMKSRAFHEMNIGVHFVQKFSSLISQMEPDTFYESVLLKKLHAKAIIVGENFRYGHGRAGDSNHLRAAGKNHGVMTVIEESAKLSDRIVSSTEVRAAIKAGNITLANQMLGRPYLLEGALKKGDQLGRTLSFPTLNLEVKDLLVPANGVYAGYVWIKDIQSGKHPTILSQHAKALPAAINIGMRPTVSGISLRIEAHVLTDFAQKNTYDVAAGFYLIERIRDEFKFQNLDELKTQIAKDTDQARSILAPKAT
jgi:riboflavin kinase/FMN adenylyltransferase